LKTSCFDAVLDFNLGRKAAGRSFLIVFKNSELRATLEPYAQQGEKDSGHSFVRILLERPVDLKWGDEFRVKNLEEGLNLGSGVVLNPHSQKVRGKKVRKRLEYLGRLKGNKEEMLHALVDEKGIRGAREREILDFAPFKEGSLLELSQGLEEEGKIRILSFSPIFLISQSSLEHLSRKILDFLDKYHRKHARESGVQFERLRQRYKVHRRVLRLALKHLLRVGRIKEVEGKISLMNFEPLLSKEEEKIVNQLEEMCLKDELRSLSRKDLEKRFNLNPQTLDRLLSFLIERKKIVQGKDGFLIHSKWLEEIIEKLKSSGRSELTVGDFKKMTNLSRKYAIPLLELLDQMGITRRKGGLHEVLIRRI